MYPARTIEKLSESTRAAFRRFMPGTDATIAQNFLYVTRKVLALVLKEVDLRAEYIYAQIFATTADEFHLKQRHGREFGIEQKSPGIAAGSITVTALVAGTYPEGIRWVSGGITYYSTQSQVVLQKSEFEMPVRALVSGVTANRIAGDEMALADPGSHPSLVPTAVVAPVGISGGTDAEDVEELRGRVLERKRKPPQGGNETDYERFAKELPVVSEAWARRPIGGPGALAVWFLNADGDIPTALEIAQVKDNLQGRRLLGLRRLDVYALNNDALDVTVRLVPDSVEVRERVVASIEDALAERRRPGLPDDDFEFATSWISEAISIAIGEVKHELISPQNDVAFGLGNIPLTVNVVFV